MATYKSIRYSPLIGPGQVFVKNYMHPVLVIYNLLKV